MAKDDAQLDVLHSTEATPIAKLSPAILDAEALVIEGVITVTWPYSAVTKSIAFILAERDPLHRRDKGQLRVEFQGAAAKALADAHLGGGDEVRLSLDGVRWEENQAWMRRPGTLEWQMKFTNRLLLMTRRAESHDVDTISVDAEDSEGDQESIEQPQTMNPSPSIEIEQTQVANPVPRTPLSVVPSKRYAYETLGPGEYTSPAFIKRARVSYGSLFEGGFDIFDEEPPRSTKKKKRRSLFNMNPTSWRYASRSPSPEVEEQPYEDEEQDEPTLANTETVMVEDHDGAKETEKGDQLPVAQPQPVMVDHGCQTREMSSSPVSGVQIIAESKSTGRLLQPTPTNPWKHPDMGHALQQPSPLSFEYATAHDVRARVHESEPIRQPEIHAPHSGFDLPMSIDPSLQTHEADVHHHQHSYDTMAPEMQPPPLQEVEAHSPQTHDGLAWVADTLAAAYPTIPTHDVHGFPQGSFAQSSYTLRASPSDETHTLASAGYLSVGIQGYAQVNEAQTMLSSSFTQSGVAKPNHSYHERREDDTETATVTATFGREGRSSPPQEDSSTDESQEEGEGNQRDYYSWNRQNGDPEEAYNGEQYAEQGSGEDEIIEEEDITESELEESGSDAADESGSEYEYESESRTHNEIAQPALHTLRPLYIPRALHIPRPFIPIPRPAPAAPKEPVVISLLSDSEDDDSDKPTTAVQAKKEQNEEPIQPEKSEADEQPSEQEDEDTDEDESEDEDEDGYEDEDEVEVEVEDRDTDDYVEEGVDVDESMDENMGEVEDESDIEEAAEIKPVVSQSSKRSSMVSQLDGSSELALLEHNELDGSAIGQFEMGHPNLILSPKSDKRQYVNIAETIVEAQNTAPIISSPLADKISPQPESVNANADNKEEITTDEEMRGISKSRSPEPIDIETPAVPEEIEEAPIAQQQQEGDQEQEHEQGVEQEQQQPEAASSKFIDSAEPAAEPSVHTSEIPADMDEAEEISILQSTTNDDQLMEDVEPAGLEMRPTSLESKSEDIDVAEPDMDMQDDVPNQLGEEAENVENVLEKEVDQIGQTTGEVSPFATEELEVVASSSPPPATLTTLSLMTPTAVPALVEQAATKQSSIPLEVQQDDQEVYHDAADTVVTEEVTLGVDESAQAMDQDVDEPVYHDVEEDLKEDTEEDVEEDTEEDVEEDVEEDDYEDAREDGGDGDGNDDDDTAIEQQLMAESQLYSTPQKAHDSPALSQPLEAIEEIHECNHAHHHHAHHHAHHHHDHHTEQSAHERGSRRAEPEMLITVQSLRSHCRAKRVSSGSSESFLTDPNASFAKGSPNKASQCLIGDEESLPQRSPRSSRSSPRSKAEHSEGNAALAKSSFQESKSPKEAGAPTSLRARRGVKGPTDASILLAQALSEPSERGPQQLNSPTASLRASRHKSDQPDPSSQLTAGSSGSSQQQLEEEAPQDAAHDASATPRRDVTPESTATGHNLRSPRKLAAGRPSSAASSVAEDVSITSMKLQLTKSLRTSLPDYLPLTSLRASLNKTADILAVVTSTPREPHRPKSGPRDYMLELTLTDPSAAPTRVIVAHIFRPHKFTLPAVQAGDIVLLRRVQVVSMQGRGFGVRAGDASAWAVYEKDNTEMLPQIKGPPVEITNEEVEYVQGLKRWWSLQDDKSLAKIDKANQRLSQPGKDDTK